MGVLVHTQDIRFVVKITTKQTVAPPGYHGIFREHNELL